MSRYRCAWPSFAGAAPQPTDMQVTPRTQVLLDNPLAYGPLAFDDGGMECAICLVAMPKDQDDDDTTVRLACGHRYHKSCLRRWLCVTGQSAEGERVVVYKQSKGCPLCRTVPDVDELRTALGEAQEEAEDEQFPLELVLLLFAAALMGFLLSVAVSFLTEPIVNWVVSMAYGDDGGGSL